MSSLAGYLNASLGFVLYCAVEKEYILKLSSRLVNLSKKFDIGNNQALYYPDIELCYTPDLHP